MSKPFKLRSGNSPMFKHVGSSPIKDEEGTKQDITEKDIKRVKIKEHLLGGEPERKTIIKDPNTGRRVKVTEKYDSILGEWIQIGAGKGRGTKKGDEYYDIEKIRKSSEEEQSSESTPVDAGDDDIHWINPDTDTWVDPNYKAFNAYKEQKLNELLKLYGSEDHPVVRQEMMNLKAPKYTGIHNK